MLKAFKYRIYPTEEQSVLIEKHFGCSRFIFNYGLNKKIKAYTYEKKKISCFDLINELPSLKEKYPWLSEVYSQTLQMSLRNLDNAFTSFFRKNAKFPNFKSKHNSRKSCQFTQNVKVYFDKNIVKFPKIGEVFAILHRNFEGEIKTCTLSKTPSNKFFVSVLVENSISMLPKLKVTYDSTIGIDVGLKDFVAFSNGLKINNPKLLTKSEKHLKHLQKNLSKKKKGSINREEAKQKVAVKHEKIGNQRKDFLHKLTHNLVCENQATMFVCENLNIIGMTKNHKLAKHISDASWGTFNQYLEYKCNWYGKTYRQIGRFAPSSKLCSLCGFHNSLLELKDRTWECPSCNAMLDRDVNAAINIKNFGYIRSQGVESESKQCLSEPSGCKLELRGEEATGFSRG